MSKKETKKNSGKIKTKKAPEKFTRIQKGIYDLLLIAEHPRFSLADIYAKQWNFVNYCIIGGIGVGINYLMFIFFLGSLGWVVTNIIAILSAMMWNWSNSVGVLCEYWGYTKNE